jgi:hypothetical protein
MALVAGALFVRRREPMTRAETRDRFRPFFAGIALYVVLFFVPTALAAVRVPAIAFFAAFFAASSAFSIVVRRTSLLALPARAHVALGAYLTAALFTLVVGAVQRSPEKFFTAIAFVALIAAMQGRSLRSADPSTHRTPSARS